MVTNKKSPAELKNNFFLRKVIVNHQPLMMIRFGLKTGTDSSEERDAEEEKREILLRLRLNKNLTTISVVLSHLNGIKRRFN